MAVCPCLGVTLLLLLLVNVIILDYLAARSGGTLWTGQGDGGTNPASPRLPPDALVRWTPSPTDPSRGVGATLTDAELATRRQCEGMRDQLAPRDFLPHCLTGGADASCAPVACRDIGVLSQPTMAFCLLGQLYASAGGANANSSSTSTNACMGAGKMPPVGSVPLLDERGWLGGRDPCTWGGITCDAGQGLPTALVLERMAGPGLGATLPPDLGYLPSLGRLSLVGAGLRGLIPRSVCARPFAQGCTLSDNPQLDTLAICASCSV